MKKATFITNLLILISAFSFSNCTDSNAQKAYVLAPNEFEAKINTAQIQLVDVRTPEEYQSGHIGNAQNININAANFKAQMEKLDKSKPVAVYCAVGGRSGRASALLTQWGFKTVYDLQGGISVWQANGKKVVH